MLSVLAGALLVAGSTDAHSSIPEDPALWAARYDGPGNHLDSARSLAVSPDGSTIFVTGTSSGPQGFRDFTTIAYSAASGAQLWVARYSGPGNAHDHTASLAVSPDGSTLFVSGSSPGPGTDFDYATVAYSATDGAQLWVARYDGPAHGYDHAESLAVSPDGSEVFVTGYSGDFNGGRSDYTTIAYSAASGTELWAARYDGPGHDHDHARSLAVSPDGSTVFVTGSSRPVPTGVATHRFYDFATIAYAAADGAELWVARYDGPANDWDSASSVALSPDGSLVFVTGHSSDGAFNGANLATIAYSAVDGIQLWAARSAGGVRSSVDEFPLAVSPDGATVFVAGGGGGANGYVTLAYAAGSGAELWVDRYPGPFVRNNRGVNTAFSLAVSPDGSSAFVTGESNGDYATVAYSAADGAKLWIAHYDGAGSSDTAHSLGVSPDGSTVFVTGTSPGPNGWFDYATLAYRSSSSCANGANESGPVSGPLHSTRESGLGPATPYAHGVNCDVVAANGL